MGEFLTALFPLEANLSWVGRVMILGVNTGTEVTDLRRKIYSSYWPTLTSGRAGPAQH